MYQVLHIHLIWGNVVCHFCQTMFESSNKFFSGLVVGWKWKPRAGTGLKWIKKRGKKRKKKSNKYAEMGPNNKIGQVNDKLRAP